MFELLFLLILFLISPGPTFRKKENDTQLIGGSCSNTENDRQYKLRLKIHICTKEEENNGTCRLCESEGCYYSSKLLFLCTLSGVYFCVYMSHLHWSDSAYSYKTLDDKLLRSFKSNDVILFYEYFVKCFQKHLF